jgi:hypothetical protein
MSLILTHAREGRQCRRPLRLPHANSSWAVVGRRKGEEGPKRGAGQGSADGSPRRLPPIMSSVRPVRASEADRRVRQEQSCPKTRGRLDGRAADIGGLGQQFTKEGPLASDARTLGRYGRSSSTGGDGGAERRRSCRSSAFSSSLPLSLSETSVPSERPVATPTSCAATTRSPTENDKRPAREGVRLVGGRLLKVICSARVRVDVREGAPESRRSALLTAAPHLPFEPRKAPSTPHFTADA